MTGDDDDMLWARGILDEQADGWMGGYSTQPIPSRCGWRGVCDLRPTVAVILEFPADSDRVALACLCSTHATCAIAEIQRRRRLS